MNSIIRFFAFAMALIFMSCGALPPELQELEGINIFKISDDKKAIILDGVINSSAFKDFKSLSGKYPMVKRVEIVNCEGSINDNVNLKLATYIHKQGFTTHLRDKGLIASGGTDLFLAGHKRTIEKNTRIGVHSWSDNKGIQATDFPKEHKNHKPYIEYYQALGFSEKEAKDFYFLTIHSAPAEDIHWMTTEEIERFGLIK